MTGKEEARLGATHFRAGARGSIAPVLVGVTVLSAAASLALPINYDEAFWLATARMVSTGATLYETAIDNKSPVVYGIYWLLDLLPGPFVVARSLMVGLIVGLLMWLMTRHSSTRGATRTLSLGGVVTLSILLLAGGWLQTELLAAPLALGAIILAREGRVTGCLTLAYTAIAVSLLAIGVLPVCLYLVRSAAEPEGLRRGVLTFSLLAFLAIGAVLVTDNLRFGLIELNLVSRSGLTSASASEFMLQRGLTASLAVLPILVLGSRLRWSTSSIVLVAVASVPALLAGWGSPHYWIPVAVVAGGVSLQSTPEPQGSRLNLSMAYLALLPLVLWSLTQIDPARAVEERYMEVANVLSQAEQLDWDFIEADLQPYLALHFPDRTLLAAPSMNYLAWENSRSAAHMERLALAVRQADVLIDPGVAEPGLQPIPELEPAVALVRAHLDRFSCEVEVDTLIIRATEEVCREIVNPVTGSASP